MVKKEKDEELEAEDCEEKPAKKKSPKAAVLAAFLKRKKQKRDASK